MPLTGGGGTLLVVLKPLRVSCKSKLFGPLWLETGRAEYRSVGGLKPQHDEHRWWLLLC